jgi:hypothetical protein
MRTDVASLGMRPASDKANERRTPAYGARCQYLCCTEQNGRMMDE